MNEFSMTKMREYKKGLLVPKVEEAPIEMGLFLYGVICTEQEAVDRVIYQAGGVNERKWSIY